jgi:hypothetical protein
MNLLPHHKKSYQKIKEEFIRAYGNDQGSEIYHRYKDNYIDDVNHNIDKLDSLMIHGIKYLDSEWDVCKKYKVKINNIHIRGTIQIAVSIIDDKITEKIHKNRDHLTSVFQRDDSNLSFHITLAYRYQDIKNEDKHIILDEIKKLNVLVNTDIGTEIELERPQMTWFKSMKQYYFDK